jgi:hypothetical protein
MGKLGLYIAMQLSGSLKLFGGIPGCLCSCLQVHLARPREVAMSMTNAMAVPAGACRAPVACNYMRTDS